MICCKKSHNEWSISKRTLSPCLRLNSSPRNVLRGNQISMPLYLSRRNSYAVECTSWRRLNGPNDLAPVCPSENRDPASDVLEPHPNGSCLFLYVPLGTLRAALAYPSPFSPFECSRLDRARSRWCTPDRSLNRQFMRPRSRQTSGFSSTLLNVISGATLPLQSQAAAQPEQADAEKEHWRSLGHRGDYSNGVTRK
jgi:hypothetical protein